MDKIIAKGKWNKKRVITIAGISLLIVLICCSYYFSSGNSRLSLDMERLSVCEIQKGPFKEFIPVNGIVMPLSTIYLDAIEGGRVEEKYVEDGAIMKKGHPVLRLSNTDLELSLVNQETSVFNLLTQMQISRNAAQQNTITKLNQMADVENTYKEAERVFLLNKQLHEQKAISAQEFKQSEIAFDYQVKRKKLTEQILKQDTVSTKEEMDQAKQTYNRTKDALELMRRKVGDLIVRAPIDGKLTSLDAEIGQSKNKGERLGQIDDMTGFKVKVTIDEHYISRIFPGLQAECVVADKTYKLTIKKIYTQVTGGHFLVDMTFDDAAPQTIRRGQTLQLRLALSDETQAILLARGNFYQQTGGNWIFKITPGGDMAYKADIHLGRQNPDYYEVLSGLKPGDKVIVSGYENFEKIQELHLKKN